MAPSKRRATADAVIQGFSSLSLEAMMAYRAPNCIHQIAPSSLSIPPLDNAAFAAHFSKAIPTFKSLPLTVKELVEDEAANKIVMWCTAHVEFREEVGGGSYDGEYMFLLEFDESGEKVSRLVEFVDSKTAEGFVKMVGEAQRKLAEKEGK